MIRRPSTHHHNKDSVCPESVPSLPAFSAIKSNPFKSFNRHERMNTTMPVTMPSRHFHLGDGRHSLLGEASGKNSHKVSRSRKLISTMQQYRALYLTQLSFLSAIRLFFNE